MRCLEVPTHMILICLLQLPKSTMDTGVFSHLNGDGQPIRNGSIRMVQICQTCMLKDCKSATSLRNSMPIVSSMNHTLVSELHTTPLFIILYQTSLCSYIIKEWESHGACCCWSDARACTGSTVDAQGQSLPFTFPRLWRFWLWLLWNYVFMKHLCGSDMQVVNPEVEARVISIWQKYATSSWWAHSWMPPAANH